MYLPRFLPSSGQEPLGHSLGTFVCLFVADLENFQALTGVSVFPLGPHPLHDQPVPKRQNYGQPSVTVKTQPVT